MTGTVRKLLRPAVDTRIGGKAQRGIFEAAYFGRAIQTFDRRGWLYPFRSTIPSFELHFRPARPVTEVDIALCKRLVDAYALARADGSPTSGMWSDEVFQDRQRDLTAALQIGSAEVLAERMASMFRADFVFGLASGSLGAREKARLSNRFWSLSILDRLVALAESLGTARAENPEQGGVGIAFLDGVEKLVLDTEGILGTSLDFPDVGAAYGIRIYGRLISSDSLYQIYAAARIKDAIRTYLAGRDSPLRMVEIGAGFGGMAYWLLQMTDLDYVIVDLPIVNVLQGYFLAQSLGGEEVSFYGEEPRRVHILPTHALSDIRLPFDILANMDSMPEIPHDAALDYLVWAQAGCDGIFYSHNQEAAAGLGRKRQNVVADLMRQLGGYERLSRDASWIRRGYAEEIYSLRAVDSSRHP